MNPSLRPWAPLFVAAVSMSASAWAQTQQNQDQTAQPTQNSTAAGPKKPTHKLNEVTTNDTIALLAVRRAPRQVEEPKAGQSSTDAKETSAIPPDVAQKNAEAAALQKQIKDKQVKVEWLMRTFVKDERTFLLVPGTPVDDPEARERIRYEQDELLWETSELAKLKAKLAALVPPTAQ